jgi:hypothetical protein
VFIKYNIVFISKALIHQQNDQTIIFFIRASPWKNCKKRRKPPRASPGTKLVKKNPKHTIRRFIGGGDRETAAVLGEEIQVLILVVIIFRKNTAARQTMTSAVVLGPHRNISPSH